VKKYRIIVKLKENVLDPQGKTIAEAAERMSFKGIASLRAGKVFDLETEDSVTPETIQELAKKILVNAVIENFEVQVLLKMELQDHIRAILEKIGENPHREGLLKTPERSARAFEFLTQGYHQSIEKIVNQAVFENQYESEMVIVKDIELYSLCEHHLLPFFGKCHVGYLPKKKIIGLSKIPRIVDLFSRRLQVQERLTTQIAETLEHILDPYGVAVVIEASHLCARMRGVEKQNSEMVTSCLKGAFRKNASTREEFLKLIGK